MFKTMKHDTPNEGTYICVGSTRNTMRRNKGLHLDDNNHLLL